MGKFSSKCLQKKIVLLFQYSFDMTNIVFPTFLAQKILDFSSASHSGTLGIAKH
jgi:hypothetical protein